MHWKALYLYYTISLHINFIHSIHIYSRRYNLIFIIKKISDLFHAFLQVSNTCISIQFEAGERPFVISSTYRTKPTLVESVPWLQVLRMTGETVRIWPYFSVLCLCWITCKQFILRNVDVSIRKMSPVSQGRFLCIGGPRQSPGPPNRVTDSTEPKCHILTRICSHPKHLLICDKIRV